MPQDLRVFGVTPEMEKAGQSAWRMLSRLPGVLGRMGMEAKPHWTNLSALKQTVGATLRVYIEKYEHAGGNHSLPTAVALKDLVRTALELAQIERFTGRKEPTVIT